MTDLPPTLTIAAAYPGAMASPDIAVERDGEVWRCTIRHCGVDHVGHGPDAAIAVAEAIDSYNHVALARIDVSKIP